AMHRHVVAERLQRLPREGIVGALDLLQADDVGLALLEPGLEAIHALANRIDVPGGNPHEKARFGEQTAAPRCLPAAAGICTQGRLYAKQPDTGRKGEA